MVSLVASVDELLAVASAEFRRQFKEPPTFCGCAPGRVNLIGEHTDYNDGFVLPMALPLVTLVVGRANGLAECRVKTLTEEADQPHLVSFPIPTATQSLTPGDPKWANYVKGAVAVFHGPVPSFDAVIVSSVPLGGGLSSSAALEVATYTFLEELTANPASTLKEKALACQKAEHSFAGMPCGIMDQFVSVLGQENNALLIDCRSLEGLLVPLSSPDVVFVICNSNYRHQLTGSEYPLRREQCAKAARLLRVTSLRDASEEDLQGGPISEEAEVLARATHVVGEIRRTLEGATALANAQHKDFGRLMQESHWALSKDFQVSCPALDQLVTLAMEVPGVLGSRMTGGGFGGCTVTMVMRDAVQNLIQHIQANYQRRPTFYIATPSQGARPIKITE